MSAACSSHGFPIRPACHHPSSLPRTTSSGWISTRRGAIIHGSPCADWLRLARSSFLFSPSSPHAASWMLTQARASTFHWFSIESLLGKSPSACITSTIQCTMSERGMSCAKHRRYCILTQDGQLYSDAGQFQRVGTHQILTRNPQVTILDGVRK